MNTLQNPIIALGSDNLMSINREPFLQPTIYALEDGTVSINESDQDSELYEISMEFSDSDEVEETLEMAVRKLHQKGNEGISTINAKKSKDEKQTVVLTRHPEVIDDYIRNFLIAKGLAKTLDAFQNEWYESIQTGKILPEDVIVVSNVYQQNQHLVDVISTLREEVKVQKEAAQKARATFEKLRRERDFHKMHHTRVVQEKTKLVNDMKKMKKQYENYEPTIQQLKLKYEIVMKEKMLMKLEIEKLSNKLSSLDSEKKPVSPEKQVQSSSKVPPAKAKLPSEDRPNPNTALKLRRVTPDKFQEKSAVKAHTMAISAFKFHPNKQILATVSDDKNWKMCSFPSGELIITGTGHKDWIGDCDFHPSGNQFATASGDGTVKVWDSAKAVAVASYTDHNRPVWSCAFHDSGNFIVSGSADHTARLWDVLTSKCKQTFRGHTESVNHVGFLPFSNTFYTCSGDKTLSFWDPRNGVCAQTFFGHRNSINHAVFSLKGTEFASCDAEGVVKLWDVRMTKELNHIDIGKYSLNKLSFDPSGSVLGVAGNNGIVQFIVDCAISTAELRVSDDTCQAMLFDNSGEYLVAAGNGKLIIYLDGTFKIFQ